MIQLARQEGRSAKDTQSSIEPAASATIEVDKKTPEKKGKRQQEKEEAKSSIKEKE